MGIRICHMTSVHKRYDGRIFQRECTSLVQMGYEVHLIVSDNLPNEERNGVYISSTGLKARNRFDRMVRASKKVYEKAIEIDADIYHFHDPELLPYAMKLKNKGKKVIFDSHEDTVEQINDKDYLVIPHLISKLFARYQSIIVRHMDAVIIVSPNFRERFEKDTSNIYMITNYPDLKPLPVRDLIKKQICFTGGCSEMWCHERIAEAVSKLDCEYIMAGPAEEDYIASVIKKGRGHARYIGIVSPSEALKIQSESLLGVMVNDSTQLMRNGGTMGNTKMFEYMMNGLPILCSDVKLWRGIVEKYDCGVCVDPLDTESICKGIKYILENSERAQQMGINGRRAVEEEYNWESQKEELRHAYEDIMQNNG